MLFSGCSYGGKCVDCGQEVHGSRSTALLFWLVFVALAVAVMLPNMLKLLGHVWWVWALAIVGEIVVMGLVLALCALLWPSNPLPKECHNCGGKIGQTSTGFYDFGFIPGLDDVFVAVAFILAQVGLLVLLHRFL
jgi:hypothetical protein